MLTIFLNIFLFLITATASENVFIYESELDLSRAFEYYGTESVSTDQCGVPANLQKRVILREEYYFPSPLTSKLESQQVTDYEYDGLEVQYIRENLRFTSSEMQAIWSVVDKDNRETLAKNIFPLELLAYNSIRLPNQNQKQLAEMIRNGSAHFHIESAIPRPAQDLFQFGSFQLEIRSGYHLPIKDFLVLPKLTEVTPGTYQLNSYGFNSRDIADYDVRTGLAILCADQYRRIAGVDGETPKPTRVR